MPASMKFLLIISSLLFCFNPDLSAQHQQHGVESPYVGQEQRMIKSLTMQEIEELKAGSGTPFNGMAKPAELNGFPGPKHVLDAYKNGALALSEDQHKKIQTLFEEMRAAAIPLGKSIISVEKQMDDAFKDSTINSEGLRNYINESADLYRKLRFVHLNSHLQMMSILNKDQVEKYNQLRGYTSKDPCQNIPEGHDPAMWKKHNGCD